VRAVAAVCLICLLSACAGASPPRASGDRPSADRVYLETEVEQAARPDLGERGPEYPIALRAARTEGTVVVQFVVDTLGAVDLTSVKFVRSSHYEFEKSVREFLRRTRFRPALLDGQKVKQRVEAPFHFTLVH
jgi:TonB family protein